MNEYELQDIWKKNLREFNGVMRLDSIIIRAMQEAINEVQSKQCNIANVVERSEQLVCEKCNGTGGYSYIDKKGFNYKTCECQTN